MKAVAVGLAIALLGASPPTGVHRFVQFSDEPLQIECPATLLCLLDLKPGETVTGLDHAQLALWNPNVQYTGGYPHLVMRPDAPNRRANFSVTTSGRHPHLYWVMAVSTAATDPMMRVTYRYDSEDRHDSRVIAQIPKPAPKPTLGEEIARQMDAACSSNRDVYGITPLPPAGRHKGDDDVQRAIHPARVCHSDRDTFVELAKTTTKRSDLPILVESTPEGDRVVQSQYADGRFRANNVAREYALVLGKTRLRIQWQPEKHG